MAYPEPLPVPKRVVTGLNADGKACNFIDAPLDMTTTPSGARMATVWVSDGAEADNNTGVDKASAPPTGIVHNGSVVRLIDMKPGTEGALHFTNSLDYAIVVKGEVVSLLSDGSETVLREGDIIVQQGTEHNWRNDTNDWTRVLFVNLPAQPVLFNGKPVGVARA